MDDDRTDEEAWNGEYMSRYRQSTFPQSRQGDESDPASSMTQRVWIFIQIVSMVFGVLVLCCWWTLLMMWFNPPTTQPSDVPTSDIAAFPTCKTDNWSGLDVFTTLASLAFARVLQAPFAPPNHVWGVRLLLLSPLGILAEMLWMWSCMIWILATRRSFIAMCSAVRLYRMRGLRPDDGFTLQAEADKAQASSRFWQWMQENTLNVVGKTSSKPTNTSARPQMNNDDPITTDLIVVLQKRKPLLTCAAYALMILQHYKIQSVTGAGFIKFIVFVYEIAFITTEIIYLMPHPGASIADAAAITKAFFKNTFQNEANPFSDFLIALIVVVSAGGSYVWGVMVYVISQLFTIFAIMFPGHYTGSLALTAAVGMAFKMLIIFPTLFGSLILAMALPFWIITIRRAWVAVLEGSAPSSGPIGSWAWVCAPLYNMQSWQRLRTAMLNYAGVVLWFTLFWDIVRVHDGKIPFVQHPDLAYNCSSTLRDPESWLFLR